MRPLLMPSPVLARFSLLLALVALAVPAHARERSEPPRDDIVLSRPAGPPIMAVVSLGEQRVTIYDAEGKILRAPVSTGQTGYETPAGIYSIIQKNREHYSNLYDDAEMPFMQRITWSGIALHAGQLPGHPASHGCIRMPYAFAEQLFDLTRMGMRVVVARDDMTPVDLAHPALFKPGPIKSQPVAAIAAPERQVGRDTQAMRLGAPLGEPGTAPAPTWRAIAAARAALAEEAIRKAEEARRVAVKANLEANRFVKALRIAEGAKRRAEAQLQEIEAALAALAADAPEESKAKLETAKAQAQVRIGEAQAHLDSLKAEGDPKIEAAAAAREAVKAAEEAKDAAVRDAKIAENKTAPVSVFISRQAQRLYVRQGFRPLFDSEVTIREPETPIGTIVFTALAYTDGGAGVRWSALAMYPNPADPGPAQAKPKRGPKRAAEPVATDPAAAKAALDRITIPQEAIDRIAEFVGPGSSLIVSDEPLSAETGKGTDFIVVMSGEPQGGIKVRRRTPYVGVSSPYGRPYRRPPYYGYGKGTSFGWW